MGLSGSSTTNISFSNLSSKSYSYSGNIYSTVNTNAPANIKHTEGNVATESYDLNVTKPRSSQKKESTLIISKIKVEEEVIEELKKGNLELLIAAVQEGYISEDKIATLIAENYVMNEEDLNAIKTDLAAGNTEKLTVAFQNGLLTEEEANKLYSDNYHIPKEMEDKIISDLKDRDRSSLEKAVNEGYITQKQATKYDKDYYDYHWYEKIGNGFLTGISTIGNGFASVVKGIGSGFEKLADGAGYVENKATNGIISAVQILAPDKADKALDKAKKAVDDYFKVGYDTNVVEDINEEFYDTKPGKDLDKYSIIKHNSKTAKILEGLGEGVFDLTVATAATVASGAIAALAFGTVKGMGGAVDNISQSGGNVSGLSLNDLKIVGTGSLIGLGYLLQGKIGSQYCGAVQSAVSINEGLLTTIEKTYSLKNILSTIPKTVSNPLTYIMSLFSIAPDLKPYFIPNKNGKTKELSLLDLHGLAGKYWKEIALNLFGDIFDNGAKTVKKLYQNI